MKLRKSKITVIRLFHVLHTDIPSIFICWIRSFFNVCRAWAQLFNVFSSSRRFTLGLPQGSVLAPLLFLFYINNLASSLNDDAVIALFADDVSILTTARKKEDDKASAQSVVNSVLILSQEWKLNLNTDKSKYVPSPLGPTTTLKNLVYLLVFRKFAST